MQFEDRKLLFQWHRRDSLAAPGPDHPSVQVSHSIPSKTSAQGWAPASAMRRQQGGAGGGRAALSRQSLSFKDFLRVTHVLVVCMLPEPFFIANWRVRTARLSENNVSIVFGGCLPPAPQIE